MRNHLSRLSFLFLAMPLMVVSLSFLGCSGDTGPAGPAGPAGADGSDGADGADGSDGGDGGSSPALDLSSSTVLSDMADSGNRIVASIDSITIDSPPVVNFSIQSTDGSPLVGLTAGSVRFMLAKLVPADAGANTPSKWVSYVNQLELTADEDPDDDTFLPNVIDSALQATNDRNGELVDNGDGSYVYTFTNDVTNITSPVAVAWEPTLTHRVGMEIRVSDPINPDNPTFDFIPNGGTVTNTRNIAATATCNECHKRLALHGEGRFTVDYCVTCHNPGTVDQDTGALVDMAHMVHAIHDPETRSYDHDDDSDTPNIRIPYVVHGFGEREHDYDEVTYPADTLFCDNCHSGETTEDGHLWTRTINPETCGGCHAKGFEVSDRDVVTGVGTYKYRHNKFETGTAYERIACITCHNPDSPLVNTIDDGIPVAPETVHNNLGAKRASILGEDFKYEIVDVTNFAEGESPVIQFKITNPNTGDPYDIFTDTDEFPSRSVRFVIAWGDGIDYDNNGSGNDYGSPVSYALGNDIKASTTTGPVDGVFTFDTGDADLSSPLTLPAYEGLLAVGMEGHPDGNNQYVGYDTAYTESDIFFPDLDSDPETDDNFRRDIVDFEKCQDCHVQLALHGGNRVNTLSECATCHNPDATDADVRNYTWEELEAGLGMDPDPAAPGDDRGEQGISFGYMLHKIHAADILVYGYQSSIHDYTDVTYPAVLSNCSNCHLDGTYYSAAEGARPVSVGSGEDPADPNDDEAITPTTALCSGCHSTASAIAHMELNGGIYTDGNPFTGTDTNGDPYTDPVLQNPGGAEGGRPLKGDIEFEIGESCATCHKAGGLVDVAVAHGLE